MEDRMQRALARWPNVPALYGWLSLDRRGRWRIQGEIITRAQIIDTISANYLSPTSTVPGTSRTARSVATCSSRPLR